MPARKHNITAAKWLSALGGIAGLVFGVLSVDWGGVAKFGTAVNFLYDNHADIEHLIDDYHSNLGLTNSVDTLRLEFDELKEELFVKVNRDSLIHIIELFNRGKQPYDSIWRLSESGHWYKTTVENHYKFEHND